MGGNEGVERARKLAVRISGDQDPGLNRSSHRLSPAADSELAVDVLEVVVHGLGRDAHPGRDLLALKALRQQLEHFELAVGQVVWDARAARD